MFQVNCCDDCQCKDCKKIGRCVSCFCAHCLDGDMKMTICNKFVEWDDADEEEEPVPVTVDEWMKYNGLSWSDFI